MTTRKKIAADSFRRTIRWIALLGVATVLGALVYLRLMGAWGLHAVIATVLGVFISIMLGCGLFALAFYSDRSGHDDDAANTVKRNDS